MKNNIYSSKQEIIDVYNQLFSYVMQSYYKLLDLEYYIFSLIVDKNAVPFLYNLKNYAISQKEEIGNRFYVIKPIAYDSFEIDEISKEDALDTLSVTGNQILNEIIEHIDLLILIKDSGFNVSSESIKRMNFEFYEGLLDTLCHFSKTIDTNYNFLNNIFSDDDIDDALNKLDDDPLLIFYNYSQVRLNQTNKEDPYHQLIQNVISITYDAIRARGIRFNNKTHGSRKPNYKHHGYKGE